MNLDLRFDFCEIFIECLKRMRPKKGGIYKKVWKEIVKEIEFMFSGTKRNVLMEQIKRGPSENEKVLSKIAEDCELLEEQVAELEAVSGCSLTELIRKFKSGKVNMVTYKETAEEETNFVKSAKWKYIKDLKAVEIDDEAEYIDDEWFKLYGCSNCGLYSCQRTRFCCNCGAEMVAEDEQT